MLRRSVRSKHNVKGSEEGAAGSQPKCSAQPRRYWAQMLGPKPRCNAAPQVPARVTTVRCHPQESDNALAVLCPTTSPAMRRTPDDGNCGPQ